MHDTAEIITVLFDYAELSGEQRVLARTATAEIRELVEKSSKNIVDIGERLARVKDSLGHGLFHKWLASEFAWSYRTAQHMMNVASFVKCEIISYLEIQPTALYLLASPSTPAKVVKDAIQAAKAGTPIKVAAVKAAIKQEKSSSPAPTKAAAPAPEPITEPAATEPIAEPPPPKPATTTPSKPPKPTDPWEDYNASLDAHAKAIELIARDISKTADFDDGHNARCEFAKGKLHHAGTVGQLRQIKRTLQESKIAGKSGDRYVVQREADHTARVAKSRKGAE